ncbi:acriflavin resistance protein [Methyloprofundus sedimenti]|uniref:Acriflavin resistance protein n=1 Tax=Methyloprofundus sedimenti TaxID=1420851 RepID=A0A1V8MA16_9GAMM|nr:efflux RND transporter permease subunit [Methyloprofundus sedimenti]OQK18405.1 acriflavin resistance protein [Methyloprofundus sedimenti]
MIRYFAAHPTISNILMMAIIAIGFNSLKSLNKESFPLLKPSKVQVTVAYPGASPADVEDGICNPLEDATDGISFLKEQECDARDNVAIFTLEMQEAGNMREFTDDIKTEIDAIQNFPENIEEPVIKQLGRINPVANIAITSDKLTATELKALAEYYRDRLIAMPQIPIVSMDGFSTHQLQVLIRPDTQQKYNLSIQNIADLISAQALELPAGTLEDSEISYQIHFDNIRKTTDELEDLTIINMPEGGEIKLGDIAKIEDKFEKPEERIELNGKPAALLKVSKNTIDDTMKVADALIEFVENENKILPEGTQLTIVNDTSTSVRDRLQLLLVNGWQGLVLAALMLLLFFSWRYTFWIALGLPISFLGGLAMMVVFGVSINMISMVALLMAIGILMDDAIVLSESIDHEYRKGKSPLDAAVDGTNKVFRGVFSSYLTSAFLFGSLLMMEGDLGQILGVLPVVLLSVLTISLIEAFLVLPHHLKHSLEHGRHNTPPKWRVKFEAGFDRLRTGVGHAAQLAMQFRYITVGITLAMLIFSVGLVVTGTVKFKAFPDLEGNNLEARILLPQGTPLRKTEQVVERLLNALDETNKALSKNESEELVKNVQLSYGEHGDVPENGTHLATLSIDILNTEKRHTNILELTQLWEKHTGALPDVLSIQYKEPKLGPAGRAIHIRLSGQDMDELSRASWEVQNWLRGYNGVSNLLDDLRPGKPKYSISLKPGALATGIDSRSIAAQLRSAYLDVKISEIYKGREAYEIIARLGNQQGNELRDFDNFTVFSKTGKEIPLSSVAIITEEREFSRIGHINHQRTVNIYGDVDAGIANTSEVVASLQNNFLNTLQERYPDITFTLKGEVENGTETKFSILSGFGLGSFGVFLLLSLQFRNFREPLIVMINIPLALIGTIWGHLIMGLDFTLPSMIGFVSLTGIVVNDSILLVEFVKYRVEEGMVLHDAARQAVVDRFRAIFLTSVTTIAGMTPLLFETSSQALILVPLVTSIVFGMLTSTVLIMLVLPAMYAIMEDTGFVQLAAELEPTTA